MPTDSRIIVDTNALISRLLLPHSTVATAVRQVFSSATLLLSTATQEELVRVLARPKFDRYISVENRQQFFRLLNRQAEIVPIIRRVTACRDPKDDMFLELAINGEADTIITGDQGLLTLHPFQRIDIITPADYLTRHSF